MGWAWFSSRALKLLTMINTDFRCTQSARKGKVMECTQIFVCVCACWGVLRGRHPCPGDTLLLGSFRDEWSCEKSIWLVCQVNRKGWPNTGRRQDISCCKSRCIWRKSSFDFIWGWRSGYSFGPRGWDHFECVALHGRRWPDIGGAHGQCI